MSVPKVSRRAARLLAGLVVLGVVLGLAGVLAPRLASGDDETTERQQIVRRATDFAVTYNTYDVADVADYQSRVKGLLTSDYDKEFVQVTDAIFKALGDKKQKSGDVDVLAVGVDDLDDDSATALVAVDAAISNTDNKAAVQRHFRWQLTFARVDGTWLIDGFESVAALTAEAGSPDAKAPADKQGGTE